MMNAQAGPSRRRPSTPSHAIHAHTSSSTAPLESQRATPVQLESLAPRWAITNRLKERDIWGLGLSSDLPVDEESLFGAHQVSGSTRVRRRNDGNQGSGTGQIDSRTTGRFGAIRLTSDSDFKGTLSSHGASHHSSHTTRNHIHLGDRTGIKSHPLQAPIRGGKKSLDFYSSSATGATGEVLGDVSRPNLRRLTSDMERRAGEGLSGTSNRSAGDSKGKGKQKEQEVEVEVLIHPVAPNETVAGIALLYGIDLSTLRKTNKLWPSDPAHLRKHLYVPLDACRWDRAKGTTAGSTNAAGDGSGNGKGSSLGGRGGGISLVRGPEEGQVTLVERGRYVDGQLPRKGSDDAITGWLGPQNLAEPGERAKTGMDDCLVDVGDQDEDTARKAAWQRDRTETSPVQWDDWDQNSSPSRAVILAESDSAAAQQQIADLQGPETAALLDSLEDPWASLGSASTIATASSAPFAHPNVSPSSPAAAASPVIAPSADVGYTSSQESSSRPAPPSGSRVLDVVRIPASQLRFFPPTKQNPSSSRTSIDSSRSSLQMSRSNPMARLDSIDAPVPSVSYATSSSISSPTLTLDDPAPLSGGGVAPKTRSKSTMVRLRPPTSTELPPTTFANRLSNLFSIPPPPPGLGSGAGPVPDTGRAGNGGGSFAANSRRTAGMAMGGRGSRYAYAHPSTDLGTRAASSGRLSLESARSGLSALSALSGSGTSGGGTGTGSGSGRNSASMSRTASWRIMAGLESAHGPGSGHGKDGADEVEMTKRGSEETLRVHVDDGVGAKDVVDEIGVSRVGSLRRGKKLD